MYYSKEKPHIVKWKLCHNLCICRIRCLSETHNKFASGIIFLGKPYRQMISFFNLRLKSLPVKLLNEVSVRLSFFFIDELGHNECVNLFGGNHCISLSPMVDEIFVQLLICGFDQGSDWKIYHFFRTEFSDSAQ